MHGMQHLSYEGATPKFLGVQICCPRLTFIQAGP